MSEGSGSKILLDFIGSGGQSQVSSCPRKGQGKNQIPDARKSGSLNGGCGKPFVFVRVKDLELKGNENMDQFDNNETILKKRQEIRSVAAETGIAKRQGATTRNPGVPKIAVVAPPAPYSTHRWKLFRSMWWRE